MLYITIQYMYLRKSTALLGIGLHSVTYTFFRCIAFFRAKKVLPFHMAY